MLLISSIVAALMFLMAVIAFWSHIKEVPKGGRILTILVLLTISLILYLYNLRDGDVDFLTYDRCSDLSYDLHERGDLVKCDIFWDASIGDVNYFGTVEGLLGASTARIDISEGTYYVGEVFGGRPHGEGVLTEPGFKRRVKYVYGDLE